VSEYNLASFQDTPHRESLSRPTDRGREALSCDPEQLWQKLADRFGDRPVRRPDSAFHLRGCIDAFTFLNRGRKAAADRVTGPTRHVYGTL